MSALLAIIGGFSCGIFVRSLSVTGWWPILFVFFLATLCGAVAFYKPRAVYVLGSLFCVFLAFGMLRTTLVDTSSPEIFLAHVGERVSYRGIVISDPDIREKNQRVAVRVSRGGESTIALVVAPHLPRISVGDRVWVSGTLTLPHGFVDDTGRFFHYDAYLALDGVRFLLQFAFIRVDAGAPWYSIPAFLARIKHAFLDGLSAALPHPYAALAGGIVIGGKTGLGNELQQAFVRSGLVQIVVLSGYNVMIVATWIMNVFSHMRLPRRWIVVSGGVALVLFVGIAGFSTTAVRAMCMALIALYARATGRTYDAGRALVLVVGLMLVWQPYYLVFDPGFGLSVVATAGIIWLAPLIEQKFRWLRSRFGREVVVTTLAAQTAVLPLLLYDMGILSFVAIPANLIVAPVVPFAMAASVIAGFAGMLFGSSAVLVGIVCALPAYVLTWFIITVAAVSSSLPLSAVVLPAFPFWVVLLAYGGMGYRAVRASKRFSTTAQFTFDKKAST